MKNNFRTLFLAIGLVGLTGVFSCQKDQKASSSTPDTPVTTSNGSFVEEFDNAGELTGKGWVFVNNSNPIGQSGWRQGRYESAAMVQYKFLAPVSVLGFPAYSAHNSPNDFISADASAVNEANSPTGVANISAWLITPQVPVKNGDKIIFYTRAVDDSYYAVYTKDRMQVRANFTDGTANVGNTDASVGNFTTLLLDINPNYIYNDPGGNTGNVPGYPRNWTKYTINISNVPNGSVAKARFAFRYYAVDAGIFGGSTGNNYPTVVGIDSLAFVHN